MAPKTLKELNDFMLTRSYVEGFAFSPKDVECFKTFSLPSKKDFPHAHRWYIHVAACVGGVELCSLVPAGGAAAPAAAAKGGKSPKQKGKPAPAPAAAAAEEEDDDDFWGDDDEDDTPKPKSTFKTDPKLEEMKKAAQARLDKKTALQRTMVVIEVKPWEAECDLMALWKKFTSETTREGLKWGEKCELKPVAYGIKKIVCTAIINLDISMDDIKEEIEEKYENDVQSIEILNMSLL